jgi:two-component system response regulator FixJ
MTARRTARPRRVHVVDDDEAVRDGAEILLDSAGYDVVTHVSGSDFLAHLDVQLPGCLLLDIHMPGLTGLQVQTELRARGVDWPVIVLTGQGDVGIAVNAMKNGAFEFIEKPYKNDGLLEMLEDAFEKLAQRTQESARIASARALIDTLTPRELDVMRALLAGLPNKLIAYELDLSVRTVEIYRANVMGKLKARGLSSAVRIAMAAGVQPIEERRPD